LNQGRSSNVILAVHVPGNGLVIYVRQKAIEPSAVYVIGVTGFFGKLVMNMVGDDVNLLRNQLNDHLTDDKKPKPVGEGESVMGSVAVQINGSMGAQNDHAVNKCNEEKFPGEIVKKEYKEKRRKKQNRKPAKKRQPTFSGFKDIQPSKEFANQFALGWNIQISIPQITIRGRI